AICLENPGSYFRCRRFIAGKDSAQPYFGVDRFLALWGPKEAAKNRKNHCDERNQILCGAHLSIMPEILFGSAVSFGAGLIGNPDFGRPRHPRERSDSFKMDSSI